MRIFTSLIVWILWAMLWLVIWLTVRNQTVALEILKVWGVDNYNALVEIYESPTYIYQQSSAIGSMQTQLEHIANPIWTGNE
jgi:hypothetical protein